MQPFQHEHDADRHRNTRDTEVVEKIVVKMLPRKGQRVIVPNTGQQDGKDENAAGYQ